MDRMRIGFEYYGECWHLPSGLAAEAQGLQEAELNRLLDETLPRFGQFKWKHTGHNLITDQGAQWLCSRFSSAAVSTNWFFILKAAGTFSAADTAQSHAGWVEIQAAYTQGQRQQLILTNPTSGRTANNSANLASVTIGAASISIAGFGLINDNVKNASQGILFGIGDYSGGPRALVQNDTYRLNASVTF